SGRKPARRCLSSRSSRDSLGSDKHRRIKRNYDRCSKTRKTNRVEVANREHTGPLLTQSVSHDDQSTRSPWKPNGDDHPFPVQQATEQIANPFHPAIFVAQ